MLKAFNFAIKEPLIRAPRRLFSRKVNYYKVLGVSRDATHSEVKKAYAKLAREFHPDKNSSPEAQGRFTEINEAYSTLSCERKRAIYNQTGMNSDEQKQKAQTNNTYTTDNGYDFSDFFGYQSANYNAYESAFRDFEEVFGGESFRSQKRAVRGADIQITIELDFFEAVLGTTKDISYKAKTVCETCKGTKCRPGSHPTRCQSCGGKGTINYRQGPMHVQMGCATCKTTGTVIKNPCQTCGGRGISVGFIKERIEFPRGINHEQTLRVSGKGNMGENNGLRGDLLVKVNVKADSYFRREGYDVVTELPLNIYQVVLGTTVDVKTLTGKRSLTIAAGTTHGQRIKMIGEGVSKLAPNDHQRGDHYVVVSIEIPKSLTRDERTAFELLRAIHENKGSAPSWTAGHRNGQSKEELKGNDLFRSFESLWAKKQA